MVGAYRDPAGIGADIVDAVGICLAQLLVDEVVDLDLFGFTGGAPFGTVVLVLPDQFFFGSPDVSVGQDLCGI